MLCPSPCPQCLVSFLPQLESVGDTRSHLSTLCSPSLYQYCIFPPLSFTSFTVTIILPGQIIFFCLVSWFLIHTQRHLGFTHGSVLGNHSRQAQETTYDARIKPGSFLSQLHTSQISYHCAISLACLYEPILIFIVYFPLAIDYSLFYSDIEYP